MRCPTAAGLDDDVFAEVYKEEMNFFSCKLKLIFYSLSLLSEPKRVTRELRVDGGVLAEALGAGLTAEAEGFAAALDFGGSTLAGGGADVRVGLCEGERDGGTLGAFLRWAGSGGERGRAVDLSDDLVAWNKKPKNNHVIPIFDLGSFAYN